MATCSQECHLRRSLVDPLLPFVAGRTLGTVPFAVLMIMAYSRIWIMQW